MEKNRSHVSDVLRLSNGRRRRRGSLTNLFPSILFFVVFFFCCVCVLFSFPRPIHANKSPGLESKRFRRTVASRGFFFVFVFFLEIYLFPFLFRLFYFVRNREITQGIPAWNYARLAAVSFDPIRCHQFPISRRCECNQIAIKPVAILMIVVRLQIKKRRRWIIGRGSDRIQFRNNQHFCFHSDFFCLFFFLS